MQSSTQMPYGTKNDHSWKKPGSAEQAMEFDMKTFEMHCYSKSMKTVHTEHTTNEEVVESPKPD